MNFLLAAVYGVAAAFVTYVVFYLLATVIAAVAPLAYPAAVIVGLLVFVANLGLPNGPFIRR